ncbi:MAG: threonine synthase, partial [Natronospirillum sp.]
MKYISTRGISPAQNFEEVLLTGLAPDGGLYVPETLPQLSREQILAWKDLPYNELAFEIIRLFTGDSLPDADLRQMIDDSYSSFSHPEVAPLHHLQGIDNPNEWILELYHGPTLAFKDFALQLLGRLLDYVLARRQQRVAILGATSGDTGSAALEGCRHSHYVDMFILHPYQRVSEVQRRQMTTVLGEHIHNIAIEGNFDDCQKIVKQAFNDQSYLPSGIQLVAVNSINWARIMAQIVYYFSSALKFIDQVPAVSFSVPTGNFGDIYAGYLAKRMGLPVEQLIIATNRNDILHRFISRNQYELSALEASLSPSMDIMVSSNFERYLFELFNRDGERVADFVNSLGSRAQQVSEEEWQQAREHFDSFSVSDEQTCDTIREVNEVSGFLLDPHSATGLKAARECNRHPELPMITLATAHPVKFSAAIEKAGLKTPQLPSHLSDLYEREEEYKVLPNSLDAVRDWMREVL